MNDTKPPSSAPPSSVPPRRAATGTRRVSESPRGATSGSRPSSGSSGAVSGGASGTDSRDESLDDLDMEPTQFEDDDEPVRRVDQDWDDADEDSEEGSSDRTNDADGSNEEDSSDDSEELDSSEDEEQDRSEGNNSPSQRSGPSRAGGVPPAGRQRSGRGAPLQGNERRPAPSSSEELLLSEVPWRLERAEEKLRQNINGKIVIRVATGADRRTTETKYLLDWSGDAPKMSRLDADSAGPFDCTISIHEQILLRIANGELNPQITMLSDRMKIEGQAALGIYFFNLVAPPV